MYHMKTITVRDLRYDFPKVERILRNGDEVEVTKRGRAIARLTPISDSKPAPIPDFMGRLRAIYGDRVLAVSGAEMIRQDRDRY